MQTNSLDTLEKSELPPPQARAILKVMEVELASAHRALATKADLDVSVANLRAEMIERFERLGAKLDRSLGEMKAEFGAKFAALDAKFEAMNGKFGAMDAKFGAVDGRLGVMDGRFGTIEGRLARWVLTCILGQSAVLAGLGYFFLAHFGK